MKKLRKQNLDQLAQSMPVLNDSEQQCCVGGTYFFNSSGDFLEQYGSSDTIRIITGVELGMKKIQAGLPYPSVSTNPDEWGQQVFGSIHGEEANRRLLMYAVDKANLGGYFSGDQIYLSVGSGISQEGIFVPYGRPTIYVKYGGLSMDSMGGLVSTIKHELDHVLRVIGIMSGNIIKNPNPDYEKWIDENGAYMGQTLDPNFKNLPYDYRKNIAECWIKEWKAYGNSFNKSNEEVDAGVANIERLCGIR